MIQSDALFIKPFALVLYSTSHHIESPKKVHKQDPVPLGREWPVSECLTFWHYSVIAGAMNSVQVSFKKRRKYHGAFSVFSQSLVDTSVMSSMFLKWNQLALLWYFEEIPASFPCSSLFAVSPQR